MQRVGFFNIGRVQVGYWKKCRAAGGFRPGINSVGVLKCLNIRLGISRYLIYSRVYPGMLSIGSYPDHTGCPLPCYFQNWIGSGRISQKMSGSGQVLITRQLEILAMFFQKLSNGDLATDQSFHLVDGGALLKSSTLSSPICPSQQSSNSSINISRRKLSKLGTQVTFRYQYCHA